MTYSYVHANKPIFYKYVHNLDLVTYTLDGKYLNSSKFFSYHIELSKKYIYNWATEEIHIDSDLIVNLTLK